MNPVSPCLENLFTPPPLPGRQGESRSFGPHMLRPRREPPPSPRGRLLAPSRGSSRPPPPPRYARVAAASPAPLAQMRPAQAVPGSLVGEALLATAPPPPVPATRDVAELEPPPPSVADLLDDSLDDRCDPRPWVQDETWVNNEPLDGEEPTARMEARHELASLAYLEDMGA